MKMKRYMLMGLLLLLCSASALANRRIFGFITDAHRSPLPGATIRVKELSNLGAVANAEGYFELILPDQKNYTLSVSYIGYAPLIQAVQGHHNGALHLQLAEQTEEFNQVVVTGTRTPKLLKDAPILTRVITEKDIRRVDATHISDLLQSELPGIEFTYAMNQQKSLNMAGFGGNSVLFLVDGERVAGETLDNVDYTRLNMDNVERIEIVKGAASSLYGSNAVGGVVNLISREASEPWMVHANGRYGANREQRYGGSVGFRAGRVHSLTHAQYTTIDDIDLSEGTSNEEVGDYRKIYGFSTLHVKEKLVYTPTDDLKLTARAGYFFRERDTSDSQQERYRSFSGGLKAHYRFSDRADGEVSYAFDQYDKSDFLVASRRDVRDYSNVQHTLRTLYNHNLTDNQVLTVGGDYLRDYLLSYQFENNGHHVQHTADVFAQFDWRLHERLNLIAGLRFDYFSQAKLSHLSPKIGAMYRMGNCSLRASYAKGFRAPTLKEMYMNFYMGNIFMIYGNADLKPESSHNFSLSAEYLKGRHNLTVTGFYNLVDHRITTAWNQALGGQVYTNMSRLRVAGMDVHASGSYPCGISWRLSYAYTHEDIRKGEPLLSSTRPHTGTARLSYDKDWKHYGLSVSLSGRYLSRFTTDVYTKHTSYEETVRQTYPGYSLWKLSLAQNFCKGMHLTMAVDNLFNYRPDYYYSNSPATIGTTFSVGLSLELERLGF